MTRKSTSHSQAKGQRREEFPKSTCLLDRSWGKEGPTIFGLSSSKSKYVDFAVLYAKKQVTQILMAILNYDVIAKTCRTLFGTTNCSSNRLPQAFIVVKQVFNLTEDSA